MIASDGLFALPVPRHDEPLAIYAGWGFGVDSSAQLAAWLTDPAIRPPELLPDLSNLTVMCAQTGDEWSATLELCEKHMLRMFREHNVRLVEVARRGPSQRDGIVVLQDTHSPVRLHGDAEKNGYFALSEEHRRNGVLPQLGGVRKCSLKAKGMPLDMFRARDVGNRPYIHTVGFTIDEATRIASDSSVVLKGQRRPMYPLNQWGWNRQDCLDLLLRTFGVHWVKSLCRQCPYPSKSKGWPAQLARYMASPHEAFRHIVDEFCTLALNQFSGLFGPGNSLTQRLRDGGAFNVLALADAWIDSTTWALYRVRRRFTSPAHADRGLVAVHRGTRAAMETTMVQLAHRMGIHLATTDDGHPRLVLRERAPESYPYLEEFYVACPDQVRDKQDVNYETRWVAMATAELLEKEAAAADLVTELGGRVGDQRQLLEVA